MVIIVHGGAGKITSFAERKKITVKICKLGYSLLKKGGRAIDAVQSAVVELENSPLFNAGTGASLNLEGKVEFDAAIMTDDLEAGAVAGVERVKNPILVARKIMEQTDHVLLVGKGAERFARLMGFPEYDPVTPEKKKKWEQELKKLKAGKRGKYFPKLRDFIEKVESRDPTLPGGTVGACAMDAKKSLAVATSTGGIFMHLPGRVGDTPVIGAGTYACKSGAVSCTGWGESIIRICLAKMVCDLMGRLDAQSAVDKALEIMNKENCKAGIIAVDKNGNFGSGFNTQQMLWAAVKDGTLYSK